MLKYSAVQKTHFYCYMLFLFLKSLSSGFFPLQTGEHKKNVGHGLEITKQQHHIMLVFLFALSVLVGKAGASVK